MRCNGPDWWFDEYERLESEYGHEPSGEEVNESIVAKRDRAKDHAKYEGDEE
jgi:hypothetical protein